MITPTTPATTPSAPLQVSRVLESEAQTAALGRELALFVSAGDWIGLSGGLGAGKSVLARALIRALSDAGGALEVPSPTFTLVQLYGDLRVPVAHCDFYRLETVEEIDELGLDDLVSSHLQIIEWPERFGEHLPVNRLMIDLEICGNDERIARLSCFGNMAKKLERMQIVRKFLDEQDMTNWQRQFFQGDASSRRYEKLTADGETCLLMDMPDTPDGPAVKQGKPYSDIAHIATGVGAVIAINQELIERGFSAPHLTASDVPNGLALIEYLNGAVFGDLVRQDHDILPCMSAAVDVLADMATMQWPKNVTIADGNVYTVPEFDIDALLIEVELLIDWFWPALKGTAADNAQRGHFIDAWRATLANIATTTPVWVLRDYHSPNLIWLPDRQGNARVGLIDTQDAVLGHPAYDLVSLLQDARVDVPVSIEASMLAHYCQRRSANALETGIGFDEAELRTAYAILGAQRATKVLGIFVRLAERDNKPDYLAHIARVSDALERNLASPQLADLRQWYDAHLPQNLRKQLVPQS